MPLFDTMQLQKPVDEDEGEDKREREITQQHTEKNETWYCETNKFILGP